MGGEKRKIDSRSPIPLMMPPSYTMPGKLANDMTCKGKDQEKGKAGCYKGCGYLQQRRRPKEKGVRKEEI